ncbi:hypothetical protein ACLBX9_15925 [Methylobacterium sp. A49B]
MVTTVTCTPAVIEEQVFGETTRLILTAPGPDGGEILGEPMDTGRSFRVRTVIYSDGEVSRCEVISVDVQGWPDGPWKRVELTDPSLPGRISKKVAEGRS